MDKFKKLNEAISELGWDAYFIKNEKSGFIEGAIIGNHMLVSHLTEEEHNGPLSQINDTLQRKNGSLSQINDIYHKMILVSDTGFWITEIDSNGSVDYKIYNNEDDIISQVSEAIMSSEIDIKTFNDNIKIMSNYPYCINLYNSDKIVMFPSEEICRKSFQKMEESIKV